MRSILWHKSPYTTYIIEKKTTIGYNYDTFFQKKRYKKRYISTVKCKVAAFLYEREQWKLNGILVLGSLLPKEYARQQKRKYMHMHKKNQCLGGLYRN